MRIRTPETRVSGLLIAVLLLFTACGQGTATAPDKDSNTPNEAALQQREDELALREETLAQREAAAEEWRQSSAEDQALAESRAADLEARERRVAQREQAVVNREQAVSAREAEVNSREQRLARQPRPEAPAPVNRPESPPPAPAPAPTPVTVAIPAGTVFDVELLNALSSETSVAGDRFQTRLVSDLWVGDQRALPAGARIEGRVQEAVALKKVGGRARLILRFDTLVVPGGATVPIEVSFAGEGKSQTKKDAATIGGAAAGGAVLGRILDKSDRSRGTVLGAILGAAVGTGIAAHNAADPVELPAGAVVSLALDAPVSVTFSR